MDPNIIPSNTGHAKGPKATGPSWPASGYAAQELTALALDPKRQLQERIAAVQQLFDCKVPEQITKLSELILNSSQAISYEKSEQQIKDDMAVANYASYLMSKCGDDGIKSCCHLADSTDYYISACALRGLAGNTAPISIQAICKKLSCVHPVTGLAAIESAASCLRELKALENRSDETDKLTQQLADIALHTERDPLPYSSKQRHAALANIAQLDNGLAAKKALELISNPDRHNLYMGTDAFIAACHILDHSCVSGVTEALKKSFSNKHNRELISCALSDIVRSKYEDPKNGVVYFSGSRTQRCISNYCLNSKDSRDIGNAAAILRDLNSPYLKDIVAHIILTPGLSHNLYEFASIVTKEKGIDLSAEAISILIPARFLPRKVNSLINAAQTKCLKVFPTESRNTYWKRISAAFEIIGRTTNDEHLQELKRWLTLTPSLEKRLSQGAAPYQLFNDYACNARYTLVTCIGMRDVRATRDLSALVNHNQLPDEIRRRIKDSVFGATGS